MIRSVIFDAVGTLIIPQPSVAEAYFQVGTRHGSRRSLAEVAAEFRRAYNASDRACFSPERQGRTSEPEERARWQWIVGEVLPDARDPDRCFQELWDHFANPAHWRCFDDAREMVATLRRRGFAIGIASNFDQRLRGICQSIDELRDCQPCVVSSEIGHRKPSPAFYSVVIAAAGVLPAELLFVGDDLECDVLAPRRAGMQAVQLQRGAAVAEPGAIRSLAELLSLESLQTAS